MNDSHATRRTILAAALGSAAVGIGGIPLRAAPGTPGGQLDVLVAKYLKSFGTDADGDDNAPSSPVDKITDFSFAPVRARAELARRLTADIGRIDPIGLDPDDRLSLALLKFNLDRVIIREQTYWHQFMVTPAGNMLTGASLYGTPARRVLDNLPLKSNTDATRYAAIAAQIGALADSALAHLKGQRARGIMLPKAQIPFVVLQYKQMATPDGLIAIPADSLGGLDPSRLAELREELGKIERSVIVPALRRTIDYLEGEYAAAAPTTVGIGQYPGGAEAYHRLIRHHLSMDVTPEVLHARGLAEIVETKAKMAEVRSKLGFVGTAEDFGKMLRTDPRFKASSPEEYGAKMRAHAAKAAALAPTMFSRMPKSPYRIERLSPSLEGGLTFGYLETMTPARPWTTYFYNGSNLDVRTIVDAMSTIVHEITPGHYFQGALLAESTTVPKLRKTARNTAYSEGWAEYASSVVGVEMGAYDDPYLRYGRLIKDQQMSSRLVLDTGMNAFGWSLDRARAYMRSVTDISDAQIASETLRYSVAMPGQALGYAFGRGRFVDMRARARAEQGAAFDIKRFHDAVLDAGPAPFDAIEHHLFGYNSL